MGKIETPGNAIELTPEDLQKFNITDTAIEQMKKEYLPLTIDGIEDTEGFEIVHTARMDVKSKRVEVEKTRKDLKAAALAYGRAVDGEAQRITNLLEPIEEHLTAEEKKITDEKDRIKREQSEALQKKKEERIKRLLAIDMKYTITGYKTDGPDGVFISNEEIDKVSDEDFEKEYAKLKDGHEKKLAEEAEKKRKEEEEKAKLEADRKALEEEKARLEKIKLEQEEKEAELKEQESNRIQQKIKDRGYKLFQLGLKWNGQDYVYEDVNVNIIEIKTLDDTKFDALVAKITPIIEKRKQAAAKRENDRIEAEKKEAAERARKETEERIQREAEEKKKADEKEKRRLARKAALQPDKEKLNVHLDSLIAVRLPKMKTEEGGKLLNEWNILFGNLIQTFKDKIKELE